MSAPKGMRERLNPLIYISLSLSQGGGLLVSRDGRRRFAELSFPWVEFNLLKVYLRNDLILARFVASFLLASSRITETDL